MALPNRKVGASGGFDDKPDWVDPDFHEQYPCMTAFVRDTKWDDGTTRTTGNITVFCKFGKLTAAVNDWARGVVAYVNAGTWEELLFMIEEGIEKDSLEWRRKATTNNSQQPPF